MARDGEANNSLPPVEGNPAAAAAAGLRYVTDEDPGIRRVKSGSGFTYRDPHGVAVRDEATLERISKLVIPPAYTDVWICPDPRGHIQATGRDTRGRKQYRYHPDWRSVRDETKYARMAAFGRALPDIRARVDADLRRRGLPKEKVVAAVVRLLELTLIRVGNDEYARTNQHFGLTATPGCMGRRSSSPSKARAESSIARASTTGASPGSSSLARTSRASGCSSTSTMRAPGTPSSPLT